MSRHSIVFFFFIFLILFTIFASSFYLLMNRTSAFYTTTTTSPFTIDITVAMFSSIFKEYYPDAIITVRDFEFSFASCEDESCNNERIVIIEICDENSIKQILKTNKSFAFVTYIPCRVVFHERDDKVVFIYRKNYRMFDFLFEKELSNEIKTVYRKIELVLDKINLLWEKL